MRLSILGLLLLAVPAAAQSASESYAVTVRAVPTSSASTGSATYRSTMSIGLAPESEPQLSASHALVAGVTAFDGALSAGPPVVLGLSPSVGEKTGGAAVSVFGLRLVDGVGPTTVTFAGAAAAPLAASGTWLQVQSPPGANPWGNPLGAVDVGVAHALGATTSAGAFLYTPAIVQESAARIGTTLHLSWHGPPGAFHALSHGTSVGVGVPIPPLEGALEIPVGLVQLTPLALAPSGIASYALPVPADPALAGLVAELQNVALSSLAPLAGVFTNRLEVTIE